MPTAVEHSIVSINDPINAGQRHDKFNKITVFHPAIVFIGCLTIVTIEFDPFLLILYVWRGVKEMMTQFTKLFSFILASVNDPPPQLQPAYRMQCHSCMSGYLEDQFMYIAHLYRKPLAFTEKCDRHNFDAEYVKTRNCTDACITLRMNDKVGGRRRNGYMRGCLSDIIHYNQTGIRSVSESGRSSSAYTSESVGPRSGKVPSHKSYSSSTSFCNYIRLRDLFLHSDRYAFDAHDHVELCTCVQALCNAAAIIPKFNHSELCFVSALVALLRILRLKLNLI